MTETDLANRALSLLGEPAISSLDDGTATAQKVRLQYEPVRDALLRSHPWDFAMERVELSRSTESPEFGFACYFPLPADCLRIVTFNDKEAELCKASFEIEGGNIATNSTQAQITYIRRVTDPTEFDALFSEVFAYRLAAACAKAITGSDSLTAKLESAGNRKLKEARFVDSNQGRAVSPISTCGHGRTARPLVGEFGHVSVVKGEKGDRGERGLPGQDGIDGTNGTNGQDGASAYEIAVANGFVGDVTAWLASLEGADGTNGTNGVDGDSAYDIAVANGFVGDEAAWLASLVGSDGVDGTDGVDGSDGVNGQDGYAGILYNRGANSLTTSAGEFSVNNATIGSVTQINFNKTAADATDVSAWLDTGAAGDTIYITSTTTSVAIPITGKNVTGSEVEFTTSGPVGSLAAVGESFGVFIAKKGSTGATGSAGTNGTNGTDGLDGSDAGGSLYEWSTDTATTEPATGIIKGNNATLSSITAIRISHEDANNASIDAYLLALESGTSTNKFNVIIHKKTDLSAHRIYAVTDVNAATHSTALALTVTHLGGSGSFSNADPVQVSFVPVGDKGDAGALIYSGLVFQRIADNTLGASISAGQFCIVTSGSPELIRISDTDYYGNNAEDFLQQVGFNDSISFNTTTSARVLSLSGATEFSDYFQFNIAGSSGTFAAVGELFSVMVHQVGPAGPSGADGADGSGLLKYGSASSTTQTSTTAVIDFDATIPENTQGTEFLTLSYTPASASSTLEIEFTAMVCGSGLHSMTVALFVDSTTNALAATGVVSAAANYPLPAVLRHTVASGSTSARTYKIRYGTSAGSLAMYINRRPAEATYGGVARAVLTVKEFA